MTAMITVRTYADLSEAQVAAGFLRQHDIAVFLPDQHLVSTAWMYQHAVGGLRLQVPSGEADRARTLLSDVDGEGHYPTIEECPACGSNDVFRHKSLLAALLGFVWFAVPIVLQTGKMSCRRCRWKWRP